MGIRLEGKVAFITGACSGIGLATAELFIAEGARVLAADIQDEAGAALQQRFAGPAANSRIATSPSRRRSRPRWTARPPSSAGWTSSSTTPAPAASAAAWRR